MKQTLIVVDYLTRQVEFKVELLVKFSSEQTLIVVDYLYSLKL